MVVSGGETNSKEAIQKFAALRVHCSISSPTSAVLHQPGKRPDDGEDGSKNRAVDGGGTGGNTLGGAGGTTAYSPVGMPARFRFFWYCNW